MGNIPIIWSHFIAAELTHSSPQVHSEYPEFCFDTGHEVKLHFALGDCYERMGRYKEAKAVLEEAWRMCKEENLKEKNESASVAGKLGWIYQ